MFQPNSLKELFKKIEDTVNEHFVEILKYIGIVGALLILLIVMIIFVSRIFSNPQKTYKETKIESKYQENANKKILLTSDEYVFPIIENFDISVDYIDFMGGKKFEVPKFKRIIKDYDNLLKANLEETTKFQFEKRRR